MSGLKPSTKLAACDPCRSSKVACDHERPVCSRCRSKGPAVTCEYRTQPFKKRKTLPSDPQPHQQPRHERLNYESPNAIQSPSTPSNRQYPNPGYLGTSSHTTIFQNLSPAVEGDLTHTLPGIDVDTAPAVEEDDLLQAANLIGDIRRSVHLNACVALIDRWTKESGVNLPLAADFITTCAKSTESILGGRDGEWNDNAMVGVARKIFRNSYKPADVAQVADMGRSVARFGDEYIRWETIGLFFTAVSRASIDMPDFPQSLKLTQHGDSLKRLALRYADRCLDISLSLDCLNDVQLVLQYENFINHSFVDGDQSYSSWKRLGDVISSILALGYHVNINPGGSCPESLVHLRQSVVARTYSADKNVSIFLGRPPRMVSKFCNFESLDMPSIQIDGHEFVPLHYLGWTPEKPFDYALDTWWSFICALLKEDILYLSMEKDLELKQRKARLVHLTPLRASISDSPRAIEARAQTKWHTLPFKYRYSGDLKLYDYRSIERDFIASARLNYLHALFMLRQAFVLNDAEPDSELLSICTEILHLTAKVAIMKYRLTNSGTGLIWKICHYGLPAAGILCLWLLRSSPSMQSTLSARPRILQNLSVLVAHVDSGILIDPSDPDYALLAAATRAIQTILDKVLTRDVTRALPTQEEAQVAARAAEIGDVEWLPWSGNENWDFEMDFWTTLVEHPTLNPSNQTTRFE